MLWKDNGELIKWHLSSFYNQYNDMKGQDPSLNVHKYAESYVNNEISMEAGMQQYFDWLDVVAKYNDRILRTIKTVKGKAFCKHLVSLMKDSGAVNWRKWEIVKEPTGEKHVENEYGRYIKTVWVDQWATGTEGDSFDGYLCVELKKGKYLKFYYSC